MAGLVGNCILILPCKCGLTIAWQILCGTMTTLTSILIIAFDSINWTTLLRMSLVSRKMYDTLSKFTCIVVCIKD